MMKRKLVSLAVSAALMSGCASMMTGDVDDGVQKADESASRAVEVMRTARPVEKAAESPVRRVNKNWIPVTKVGAVDQRTAPMFSRNVVVNRRLASLAEATSYITSLTGVPASVAANAMNAQGAQGMPMQGPDNSPVVSYTGRLSGLLDVVAAKFNVYWEPEGEGVRFFRTKPRTFRLAALPGDASMSSTVGTQSSSSGSTNGASTSPSSEQRSGIQFAGLSIWKGMEDSIKTMLTQDGKVVVTPATGTITVDDTPPTLDRVAKFVEEQNIALSRQVVLNVRVLVVELADSDNYGLNWDAIYKNLGRGVEVALSSAAALPVGGTGITFGVIDTDSMWNGSDLIVEALSKQGKVSQITSASLATTNNQPAPIQVGRQTSYLASSTTTLGTAGAANTTTLTPGTVTTGFSMSMLPHILDNGRLMLQYSGDISALVDIVTVTSGDSSIQTPEIDTRNFLQRVIMNNGETLVLTGFEQFTLAGNKQGVGNADNLALGGSFKTQNEKSVLVVLIQPIMNMGTN